MKFNLVRASEPYKGNDPNVSELFVASLEDLTQQISDWSKDEHCSGVIIEPKEKGFFQKVAMPHPFTITIYDSYVE